MTRRLTTFFPLWVLVVTLSVGVALLVSFAKEARKVDGWPRETVHLKSSITREPPFTKYCGKGGGLPHDDTWESQNAPHGLPSTFVVQNQCATWFEVGDTTTAVRVVGASGDVRTYIDPVLSFTDGAGFAGIGMGFCLLLYGVAVGLARLWRKYFWRADQVRSDLGGSGPAR